MSTRFSILLFISLGISLLGCDYFNGVFEEKRKVAQDDVLLASLEDRELYLSEVEDMISSNSSSDSINQLNSFVESWVKRNVVLTEAEDNFPENIDISKLVEDYKSSLLLHNYRQVLIEKELDTTVTLEQERTYYEANKSQFKLETKICQARIAVIPEKASRIEKFHKNWNKDDSTAISNYLEKHATSRMDDIDKWYTVEDFLALLPRETFKSSDIKKSKDLQKNHEDQEYFVKIHAVLDQNDTAPLLYIKDNIRKLIIHHRKTQILDNIEQNLYQKYLKMSRIKVFTKE